MLDPDRQRRLKARQEDPGQPGNQEGPTQIFDFFDTALAIPRGIGNAAGEIYDLADTLTFDLLPDTPEGKLFGSSSSVVGGLVEGAAQFATGFIPATKFLAAGGKISKSLKIARGLSTQAERALRIAKVSSKRVSLARNAVAGVVADIAVFDGHEARLSNLIEAHPALANPITEFLAASPDDGEIEGRLKGALEGLGIGFAIDGASAAIRAVFPGDGTVAGLKGIRAKKAAEAAGAAAKDAEQAGEAAYQAHINNTTGTFTRETLEATGDPGVGILKETAPAFSEKKLMSALAKAKEIIASDIDAAVNPRTLVEKSPGHAKILGILGEELNIENFANHDTAAVAITLQRQLDKGLQGITLGAAAEQAQMKQTLDQISAKGMQVLADTAGVDIQVAMARQQAGLEEGIRGSIQLASYVESSLHTLELATKEVVKRMRLYSSPGGSKKDLMAAMKAADGFATLAGTLDAAGSQSGRLQRVFRGRTLDSLTLSDILDGFSEAGGEEKVAKAMNKLVELIDKGGIVAAGKIARRTRIQKGFDITLEYWMNSLLSGPKTQVVNSLSNFLVSIYRPIEHITGGVVGRTFGGGQGSQDLIDVGVQELSGLYHGFKESMSLAVQSFVNDKPLLDPNFRKADTLEGVQSRGQVNPDSLTGTGRVIHALGTVMRFPTRMLSTSDEFFKQMNFRSSLYAELHLKASRGSVPKADIPAFIRENFENYIERGEALTSRDAYTKAAKAAEAQGIARDGDAFKAFVKDHVAGNFDSEVARRALESARESTFTKELQKGTVGRSIQNMVNAHPYLRFAMPFVRTPLNILNFAGQRIDAPGLAAALALSKYPKLAAGLAGSNNRLIQDVLSNDPRRKFEALGRVSVGFGAATYFMGMAANEAITGRGPTDIDHRKLLEQSGWKPYSILVGGNYISYQRVDPFATLMGISADLMTYGQYADTDSQGEAEVLMGALVSALSNNVMQKSYLTGMSNLVGVLEDPERNADKFLQQLASSFVPNVLNQTEDVSDPYLRDVRSMLDAFTAKIPGLSSSLPPIRNILGEKVTKGKSLGADQTAGITNFFLPIQYTSVSSETVEKELSQLGHGFSPPGRVQGGVDLTEILDDKGVAIYDRFQELIGTKKVYGKTLRDTLTRLIKSSSYQRLPLEGIDDEDSPRVGEINAVLRRFRHAAITELRREVPALNEATIRQREARQGLPSSFLR